MHMKISERKFRQLVSETLSRNILGRPLLEAGPTVKIVSAGVEDSGAGVDGLTPEDPSYWRELTKQSLSLASGLGEQTVESIVSLAQFTYTLVNEPGAAIGAIEDSLISTKFKILAKMSDATDLDADEFLALAALISGDPKQIEKAANLTKEDILALKAGTLFHDIMGVVSMVPVGGFLAAVVDGVVYAAEGDNEKSAQCFVIAGMMVAMEAASAAPKPGTALEKTAAQSVGKTFTAAEEKYLAAQRLALRPSTEGERAAALKAMETMEKKTPSLKKLRDPAVDSPRAAQPTATTSQVYDETIRNAQKSGGQITIPSEKSAEIIKTAQDIAQALKNSGMTGASSIGAEITAIGTAGSFSVSGLSAQRATEAVQAAGSMLATTATGETVVAEAAKRDKVLVYKPVELSAEDRAGSDWLDSLGGRRQLGTPEARALRNEVERAQDKWLSSRGSSSESEYKARYDAALEKYYREGTRDPYPGEAAMSQGTTPEGMEDLRKRAKSVLSSKAFSDKAKALYSRIGPDVNIIPIIGSHEAVFQKYMTNYPRWVATTELTGRQIGKRVVVTSAAEGKEILSKREGVEVKSGDKMVPSRIDTSEIGPSNITIVPITNAAGMDSMPTAWMIVHGIFDSAAGNLLVDEGMLPKTKEIVDRIVKIHDELNEKVMVGRDRVETDLDITIKPDPSGGKQYYGPDGKRIKAGDPLYKDMLRAIAIERALQYNTTNFTPENALGISVNSGWAKNSRTIFRDITAQAEKVSQISAETGAYFSRNSAFYSLADRVGMTPAEVETLVDSMDDLGNRRAPAVGQRVESIEDLPRSALQKTKQATSRVSDYINRGRTDHVAETMSAALTQPGGYQPDFSHLETQAAKDLFGESGIETIKSASQEIQDILGPGGKNIKEAFAEDMEGRVLFVFPD